MDYFRPVPHRASSASRLAAVLAAALSLLPACSSSGSAGVEEAPDYSDRPALPEGGVQVGWMSYRAAKKDRQITALTLLSESSPEGKLLASGRGVLDGGKVVDDGTAADLLLSFERAGFNRFALRVHPGEAPVGAIGSVWINRGNGPETLFLTPGARGNPETYDLPDVYDGLKKLIFLVHQRTPGSVATSGAGFAGDDLMNQHPGKKGR